MIVCQGKSSAYWGTEPTDLSPKHAVNANDLNRLLYDKTATQHSDFSEQKRLPMPLETFFKHHAIKGKDISVVDDHHKALAAWVLVRRSLTIPPNLITIDHHTDTIEAFLHHSHWEVYEGRTEDQEVFRIGLVAQIDWRSDESIAETIGILWHDEHIDAATASGVLGDAFCIQLSDAGATPSIEQLAFEKSMNENWPSPPTIPKPQRPMTYEPAHRQPNLCLALRLLHRLPGQTTQRRLPVATI